MKVIIIKEENHGIICCAKNYKSSIRFLIKEHWLDDNTEVWDEKKDETSHPWSPLAEVLGEDWTDIIENQWNLEDFNDFFYGSFYLYEKEIYEGE